MMVKYNKLSINGSFLFRYGKELPHVDVFVCTADPTIEPPTLVINTILSIVAYDYPTEKLNVYLSDDGGSELTFYALLQAAEFCKHWIPYCKMYNVMPRCPAAFFAETSEVDGSDKRAREHFTAIKVRTLNMSSCLKIKF